jgi:hypothetical protein
LQSKQGYDTRSVHKIILRFNMFDMSENNFDRKSIAEIRLLVDSTARTYANFYLDHPDINTNLQINLDFQMVIRFCIDHIDSLVDVDTEGSRGSASWWRDLYKALNCTPPDALKRYLDWVNWE